METMQGTHSFPNSRPHPFRALCVSLLLGLTLSGTALGQRITVSGTVTAAAGGPLLGVAVRVEGTDNGTFTNASGKYTLQAASDGVLNFTLIGQRPARQPIGGRTTIDVTMAKIAFLEEIVVTAYSEEQRRGDITGAVSSVNVEAAQRETGASVLQRLDATVPGVTVVSSGSPGSRSTVRIRGISSFQNNDPLYVIDGTPVQESYLNFLNPDDIVSVQVLKDASAASIYGSRASNGVILIETTKRGVGGPPRMQLRVRTGVATPTRGYDDMLITNALDYFQVVKQSYLNAGLPVPTNIYGDPANPSIPQYIFASGASTGATDKWGRPTNVDVSKYSYPNSLIMQGSPGTNWWSSIFGPAQIGDYNLDVSGGGAENSYRISFNYFDQAGTAKYNDFKRGSVRANTSFTRNKLSFGENVAVSVDRHYGGLPDDPGGYAEDGILGKNILMQPVIPVRDIAGNFAGGKATGLGNQSNPLKYAYEHRNDIQKNGQVFGNVFGGFDPSKGVSLKTRLGFNVGQNAFSGFNPAFPENAEATFTNSINENNRQFTDWGWSNTATLNRALGRSTFNVLLGEEAGAGTNRFITASIANLLNSDPNSRFIQDALGDAATKNVSSTGGKSALLSLFGKADYNFADKYVASVTVRRDGSSRLAPGHQWGTFPAVGLGWKLSNESFMSRNKFFSDVMLRYGYGVTGNQLIPTGRIVAQFGGSRGDTYYDVAGSNTSVAAGFRETSLGNPDLRWEENRSTNVGADIGMFNGAINLVFDVYQRATDNLLFDPALPATAGIAAPPIVNVGKMKNTGIDVAISHSAASWNVTFNGSHYKNEIVSIDGVQNFFYGPITTRYGNQIINKVGSPIGSFYGYIADGFFRDAADVASHAKQEGAAPGRIKFRDVNGDGKVTLDDRTVIGNPHPSFTAGVDVGFHRGNWDLAATVSGTYGNDIFENQMEFYVFREFSANVLKDLLANSWTPENPNAKYPRLDVNDLYSHALSSYYVKSGSYTRLRNVQLGYNVPSSLAHWMSATKVYVQADNLFTITGYKGLDPALPAANVFGPAGDIRDQYRGIDRGSYPSNRVFSIGLLTSF
jgi:TonB-linked SusC/RagA family outer membrane protein